MYTFNRDGNRDCPCNGCEDRDPECHGKCEKYGVWRKGMDVKRQERFEAQQADTMSEAKKRQIWRKARYSRRKKLPSTMPRE